MLQSLTTAVSEAKPKSKSLRATIPEGVVVYLQLESGDRLEWRMEIADGQKIVLVRKAPITVKRVKE